LVLLALLAGIVGTSYGLFRADQQRRAAEQARGEAVEKQTEAEKQQRRAETGESLAAERLGQVEAEKKKVEAAADSERKALVDSHTSLGVSAGEQNKPHEAILWFASAANLAHQVDPQRELDNRTRFSSWARRVALPVALLPHGGTGRPAAMMGQDVSQMAFDPTERYLLVSMANNAYALWDIQTGEAAKLPIAAQGPGCAAWSPDGKLLAIGSPQGKVDLYSFPDCRLLHALNHPGVVRALTFSGDGNYLAIGSETVRVWNTVNKEFLAGEISHPRAVVGLDFDPGSRRLATSCLDNKARVFAIDGQHLGVSPIFPPVGHIVNPQVIFAYGFCATFVGKSGLVVAMDYSAGRARAGWLDAGTGKVIRSLPAPGKRDVHDEGQPGQRQIHYVRRPGM
jgi:hypothetical protein